MCVSPLSATVLNSFASHTCHLAINKARITAETQQPSVTCHSFTPRLLHAGTQTQRHLSSANCLVAAQTATARASRHHPSPPLTGGGSTAGTHTGSEPDPRQATDWTHTQAYLWGWTNTNTHKTRGHLRALCKL